MRVLLDECVPRALRNDLVGHAVTTVAEAGWAGVTNGELLRRAAGRFDLMITIDRNLECLSVGGGADVQSAWRGAPRLGDPADLRYRWRGRR